MPLLRCRPVHALTHENPFLDGALTSKVARCACCPMRACRASPSPSTGNGHAARARCGGIGCALQRRGRARLRSQRRPVLPGHLHGGAHARWRVHLRRGTRAMRGARACSKRPAIVRARLRPHCAPSSSRRHSSSRCHGRDGSTAVIAGYPWFGPWGRDTLIALPAHLAWNDFERTSALLESLLAARVHGLIPNIPALAARRQHSSWMPRCCSCAPCSGSRSTRATIASRASCPRCASCSRPWPTPGRTHAARRRHRRVDRARPWALTWMDAMIDGQPVTPRAGYAIEIDALLQRRGLCTRPRPKRAPLPALSSHVCAMPRHASWRATGTTHAAISPIATMASMPTAHCVRINVGTRPAPLPCAAAAARASLDAVTKELLTPAGLRTLSPRDPAYRGQYAGPQAERDRAYHQGTVWPWLLGVYADAVIATRGHDTLEPCWPEFRILHAPPRRRGLRGTGQ